MSIFRHRSSASAAAPSPLTPSVARPADRAYVSASYCFDQYRGCLEQRRVAALAESYEHAMIVHDKWMPQAAFVSDWVCQRIEQIAHDSGAPPTPGEPVVVLLVGATSSRANQLIAAFYSCVDFTRLAAATGYDVAKVYHEGTLISALRLEAASSDAAPVVEVHACAAPLSLGYRRNLRALFVDGFDEFVRTPGAVERCLRRFIGRISDDGVAFSVCVLVPVYDDHSAALAATLCPRAFCDTGLHKQLSSAAFDGLQVARLCRAEVRCLTQALVDDMIIFHVRSEAGHAKRSLSARQRPRPAPIALTLTGRHCSGSTSTSDSDSDELAAAATGLLTSPRPVSAAPTPSSGARLRRTLARVANARKLARMFDSSESRSDSDADSASPPPPPPPRTQCPGEVKSV